MDELEKELLTFSLKLYSNQAIPRNIVQIVLESIVQLLTNVYNPFILIKMSTIIEKNALNKLNSILQSSKLIFDKFSTESKRFSLYNDHKLLTNPQEITIGKKYVNKYINNESIVVQENTTGQYIPLQSTLKSYLEIPGAFNTLTSHINYLKNEKNIISNLIQCDTWKKFNLNLSEN